MSGASQPPGWYPAEGDPAGTVRWWDGNSWVGGPQAQGAQQQAGYVAPGGSTLPTGQELADPWLRIGADLIDSFLLFGVMVLIVLLAVGGTVLSEIASTGNVATAGISIGISLLIGFLGAFYYWGMNSFVGGTLGKLLLGIRITDSSGNVPIGPSVGLVRSLPHVAMVLTIIPVIGGIFWFVLWLSRLVVAIVSLVFMFTDPQRRSVLDRLASTYVVKA